MGHGKVWRVTLTGAVLLLAAAARAATDYERAEEHYRRTDYGAALDLLLPLAAKDAAVHALIGKTYYMDGRYKSSAGYLEKAVAEDPGNSGYQDWLGRAYGRLAEEASFLSALPNAKKTRAAFERAVALDPTNLEALSDLFEYYLEAPGIVGGGAEKAEAIAARIRTLDEAEYHYCRAQFAAKGRDRRAEEAELRRAMQLAPGQVGRVLDLAGVLYRQGRYPESEELFGLAGQMEPGSPRLMYSRAAAYIQAGRNLAAAKALLRQYGEARITPDDPSRPEAARLMKSLPR